MAEKSQPSSVENLRNEYSEVNENFRHFSSLRFAIFSVYFAIQAGIFAAAFKSGGFSECGVNFAKVGGLLITLVFWGYQERNVQLIAHFMKVATKLESQLGYTQMSTRPPAKFPIPDINTITRIFFPFMVIFWIYTLFVSCS
jgi:hypothetical protein